MGKTVRASIVPLFIPHMGCPHHCSFCDQKSISGQQQLVTPETVANELRQAFSYQQPAGTEIAFFGGSFTCLPQKLMVAFLEEAQPYLQSGQAAALRCSTRPDGITDEILALLRRYGVTTVELGAQSLDDTVLLRNRRGHTAQDVFSAVKLLRQNGFRVGLQIMTGLPGDTPETLEKTVRGVLELHPDMLRIYPTVVLRGTVLEKWMLDGSFVPMGLDEAVVVCTGILAQMDLAGIPVIRLGLHASRTLEQQMVGGAYHPAFRELCESRLFRDRVDRELCRFAAGSRVLLRVSSKDVSRAVGQKRENICHWRQMGFQVTVRASDVQPGSMLLTEDTAVCKKTGSNGYLQRGV